MAEKQLSHGDRSHGCILIVRRISAAKTDCPHGLQHRGDRLTFHISVVQRHSMYLDQDFGLLGLWDWRYFVPRIGEARQSADPLLHDGTCEYSWLVERYVDEVTQQSINVTAYCSPEDEDMSCSISSNAHECLAKELI